MSDPMPDAANVARDPYGISDRLRSILVDAARESGCRSVAIARRDGLVIAHLLPQDQSPRVASAVAASIFGAAEVAAREFDQEGLEQIIISCVSGKILAYSAGPDAVIVAVYDSDANLGLASLTMSRAGRIIAEILEEV